MDYKARLRQILDKRNKGESLTVQDTEDFAKIQRIIKTKDFNSYCHAIRPNYKWTWFQEYIQDKTTEKFNKKNGRIICKMPQQHGKTEIWGRCAVSYVFGKFPEWRILYLTFSDKRAYEVSADILGFLTEDDYFDIFPNVRLKDDVRNEIRAAKMRRQKLSIGNFTNANSKRGEFKAVGIEGSYNGYDANLIILDDFFSGYAEANSQVIRDSRWNAFVNNVLTRQQKDTIILVMSTQWHSDDIIGRLEEYIKNKPANAPDWEVIQFNALKDDRDYPYDHREAGEYLWAEERLDVYLEKQALDPVGWMTTYQNTPPSMSGTIFNASHFRWYDYLPPLTNARIVISMDPNYKKDSKQGDAAAIVVLAFIGMNVYLLEFSAINKVNVLDNCKRIREYVAKYPNYHSILIEEKAQGEDIVTLLRHAGLSKVQSFMPKGSKAFRAQTMIPYCEAGQYHLPTPQKYPNIQQYINQFMAFTGFDGGTDDLVDATTQVFIKFNYLLEPITLEHANFSIKNKYGTGTGLTHMSNPLERLFNNGKKSSSFQQKYNR